MDFELRRGKGGPIDAFDENFVFYRSNRFASAAMIDPGPEKDHGQRASRLGTVPHNVTCLGWNYAECM